MLYCDYSPRSSQVTPYQNAVIILSLSTLLSSLEISPTLHVLHARIEIATRIKNDFQGHSTLIIPVHCHEILKCCPLVTKVWCNRDGKSALVTLLQNFVKVRKKCVVSQHRKMG